jgi:hypothetical protein
MLILVFFSFQSPFSWACSVFIDNRQLHFHLEYFLLSLSFEYPESMIEVRFQGKDPVALKRKTLNCRANGPVNTINN